MTITVTPGKQLPAVSTEIYRILRARRAFLGVTQDELSESSGVSRRAISLIETGETRPQKSTLQALASALGIDLDDPTTWMEQDRGEQ